MNRLGLLVLAGAVALTLGIAVGCSKEPPAVFATADNATVIMDGFEFTPPVLKVPMGTNVTWINKYPIAHRVSSNSTTPNFTSPSLTTGAQYSWTFDKTGNYSYYCVVHPTMNGRIEVITLK